MLVRRLPAGANHAVEVCFTERADGDFAIDGSPDELLARRSGLMAGEWTWLRQVHGTRIVTVGEPGEHAGSEADGAATRVVEAPVSVQTADCVPVVLVADGGLAVVHVGWRGAVAGVVDAAVRALEPTAPGTVRALVGPCIRPANYEFGADDLDDVAAALDDSVRGTTTDRRPALDMAAAAAVALRRAGIMAIDDLGFDTADARWWSHRTRGDTGRQTTVARLVSQ